MGGAGGRGDRDRPREPGWAGAAGGTGFAALALLDAELRPGIELMLEWLDFDRALDGADLVITGEGSLDEQSLAGKAPVGVAKAAARAGVTTVAVAGRSLLSDERLRSPALAGLTASPTSNRTSTRALPTLRRCCTKWDGASPAIGFSTGDERSAGAEAVSQVVAPSSERLRPGHGAATARAVR